MELLQESHTQVNSSLQASKNRFVWGYALHFPPLLPPLFLYITFYSILYYILFFQMTLQKEEL